VDVATGEEVFRSEVYPYGTNNIGEFLAIVHALALLKKQNSNKVIYSDSATAIRWVERKMINTNLERNDKTEDLYKIIDRALAWLKNNSWENKILKWDTRNWGEIPADFGRK
jgi:ribonuclease HI